MFCGVDRPSGSKSTLPTMPWRCCDAQSRALRDSPAASQAVVALRPFSRAAHDMASDTYYLSGEPPWRP
eukprot:scaffold6174_cov125-Isochrysis_galbana.AAC.2